jgi:Tfp pilus assembly protein FimT
MPPRTHPRSAESGFTLAELLVTLLVVALVLLGVLALFDMTSRTARTQTHLAEMQQSLRVAQQTVVRAVRMAGRGGLPAWDSANPDPGAGLPNGLAVAVANNVADGTQIGGSANARVLAGTDVVTVRGVFSTPIYQINPAGPAFAYNPGDAAGSLTLASTTPTGAPQPLTAIAAAIQRLNAPGGSNQPEALLLVSPLGDFAVVQMVPGGSAAPDGSGVVVQFQVTGGDFNPAYLEISRGGAYPASLRTVAYAGILEEYQFYVREVWAVPGDSSTQLMPELVRARLYPNTGVAHARNAASLTEVIADNVLDLQVSLGIDRDGNELIEEALDEDEDPAGDEWMFNAAGDDPTEGSWNVGGGSPLYYLRINTLVRTDRAEPYYEAEALTTIEDKDYSAAELQPIVGGGQARYHRRQLRTIVDLRNL